MTLNGSSRAAVPFHPAGSHLSSSALMFYLTQMCCGQTSILVNWHHIIDLYICRLHASPFELEYKAVGAPWISLIKIIWTNKKKTHLERVQISINNKQCTFVCDCTLTFSTVAAFNEFFCCSENGNTGGFWVHLWRRWDCLNDAELADVRLFQRPLMLFWTILLSS